jgi:hypothetical protein
MVITGVAKRTPERIAHLVFWTPSFRGTASP